MTDDDKETLSGLLVVDGLEGGLARVELPDGTLQTWPLASLPRDVREGDVIRLEVVGGDLEIEIDPSATRSRLEAAQRQLDALNQDGPIGDITL